MSPPMSSPPFCRYIRAAPLHKELYHISSSDCLGPLILSYLPSFFPIPQRLMPMLTVPHMAFAFGILGNIVSMLVYLAPVPTFYRIYKRKSTEGFQSIPYSVALFSAMLLLYYAFVKTDNQVMLITINSVGLCIEVVYLLVYIIYAPRPAKIYTAKLLILFNTGLYSVIVLFTFFFSNGHRRTKIVGWICAIFSVIVFAAPLSIMRLVIRTKSVEYMPFALSFFLTVCAVMWFFYGLLIRDFFIAFPNVLGFSFGIAQMILYAIYKDAKKGVLPEFKLQELPNCLVFPDAKKAENTDDTKPNEQPEDTATSEGELKV